MLCALIMAGGKGTRFWPLSTEEKPKQFLKLIGQNTMIQTTVDRIRSIIPEERIFICTGEKYFKLVREQLPLIPERNIILEPEGRNTTPCIALSALIIERYYKGARMVVLPSDHLINNEEEFRNILQEADDFVKNNQEAIVTLGMNPSRPETGYGYIKYGSQVKEVGCRNIIKVDKFVEKPDKETAENYLKEKCYLWNGGMFIWSIQNIINEIKRYSSNTYEALHEIGEIEEDKLQEFTNKVYSMTEAISIDYSVLEKSKNIYVIQSNIGWDDIGTWRAIERYKEKDKDNNIINDNVLALESKSNMTINNDKKVIMIGIKDIMTVETDDSIFIVNKEYMDNLRDYKNYI